MPLFYSAATSSPSIEPLPAVVILDDRSFAHHLDELEHTLGEKFDRKEILRDIVKALRRDDAAQLELEYLCLDMCTSGADEYVQAINKIGALLHSLLHYQHLYRRGELPYVMLAPTYHGLILMRRDEYHRRVKQELDEDAQAELVRQTTKRVMSELKGMAQDKTGESPIKQFMESMAEKRKQAKADKTKAEPTPPQDSPK